MAREPATWPELDRLPQGFILHEMTSKFKCPMGMIWLDADRALVIEKENKIMICHPNAARFPCEPYIQFHDGFSEGETGVISVALDPGWPAVSKFYAYWGYQRGDDLTTAGMRISSFSHVETSGGLASRADYGSETLIWRDTDVWGDEPMWHYGGQLAFGPDGHIYLGLGDKYMSEFLSSPTHHAGCIIRVAKDGSIPSGNLDANVKPGACWAQGLRNPFKGYWDIPGNGLPNRYIIAEIGGNDHRIAREDVHIVDEHQTGVHFGWPFCEGECNNPDFPSCDCAIHDDPVFSYDHSYTQHYNGNTCIIGGVVTRNQHWPEEYYGAYWFADFNKDRIEYLKFDQDGSRTVDHHEVFHYGIDRPLSIAADPYGNLWFTSLIDFTVGKVYKLSYNSGNTPPVVTSATASVSGGVEPLTVTFSAAFTDVDTPDADLVPIWHFGDGTTASGTSVVHTFEHAGIFTAHLYVADDEYETPSGGISIVVGERPTVRIIQPTVDYRFKGGDTIDMLGMAQQLRAGTAGYRALTSDDISWRLGFIHDDHVHPIGSSKTGTTFSYTVPKTGHSYAGRTGLRVDFTAINAFGLTGTSSLEVWPLKVDMLIRTSVAGLAFKVDGATYHDVATLDTMVGFFHKVAVTPAQCFNNVQYVLSDEWTQTRGYATEVETIEHMEPFVIPYLPNGNCQIPELPIAGLSLHLSPASLVVHHGGSFMWNDATGNEQHFNQVSGSPEVVIHPVISQLTGLQAENANTWGWLGPYMSPAAYVTFRGHADHIARSATLLGDRTQSVFVLAKSSNFIGTVFGIDIPGSTGWNLYSTIGANRYLNGDRSGWASPAGAMADAFTSFGSAADDSALSVAEVMVFDSFLDEENRKAVEDHILGKMTEKELPADSNLALDYIECATSVPLGGTAVIECSLGGVISGINFASFGTATGACGVFQIGGCHDVASTAMVFRSCVGKDSCEVQAPVMPPPCVRQTMTNTFRNIGLGRCLGPNRDEAFDSRTEISDIVLVDECKTLCLSDPECRGMDHNNRFDRCVLHHMPLIVQGSGGKKGECWARNVQPSTLNVELKCSLPATGTIAPTASSPPTKAPTKTPTTLPTSPPTEAPTIGPTESTTYSECVSSVAIGSIRTLQCTQGGVITHIVFASVGSPTGTCGSLEQGVCHDAGATDVTHCIGQTSCDVGPGPIAEGSCAAGAMLSYGQYENVGAGCCEGASGDDGTGTETIHHGVSSLEGCKELCDATARCTGVDYNSRWEMCGVQSMTILKAGAGRRCGQAECWLRSGSPGVLSVEVECEILANKDADPAIPPTITSEPSTSVPATSEPSTSVPATSEPSTSAPATSEPSTSAPATPEPSTSAPATSEPSTSAPATSEPSTSAPATPAPATSAPATPAPATPSPTITLPPTTSEPTMLPPTSSEPTTSMPTPMPTQEPSSVAVVTVKRCSTEQGVDLFGFDIPGAGHVRVSGAAECSELCVNNAECMAYTFIWNRCYPKTSAGGRRSSRHGISGACTVENVAIATSSAPTPMPTKAAVVVATSAPTPVPSAVAVVTAPPTATPTATPTAPPTAPPTASPIAVTVKRCSTEQGVDLFGFDIPGAGHVRVSGAAECSELCVNNAECMAYTFIWNRCYPKTSAGGRKSSRHGISGVCA